MSTRLLRISQRQIKELNLNVYFKQINSVLLFDFGKVLFINRHCLENYTTRRIFYCITNVFITVVMIHQFLYPVKRLQQIYILRHSVIFFHELRSIFIVTFSFLFLKEMILNIIRL